MFFVVTTEYHCPKCDVTFSENKLPNINKVHKRCGTHAKVLNHTSEKKDAISPGG